MSATPVLVAFGAGFLSFLAPCVLPLVPGYLSAVSSVEAERLGEPGARRAGSSVSSLPFVAGLVTVFVLLGAGAAAIGLSFTRNQFLLEQIAGFILIVFGFAFMGLLPWPRSPPRSRTRPGRAAARLGLPARGRLRHLRRALYQRRARIDPCSRRRLRHGLGGLGAPRDLRARARVPFLIAAALFVPAMGFFRRVRDHYVAIQFVSGLIMVALGALLFAGEFWRLRVYLNRIFEALGISG